MSDSAGGGVTVLKGGWPNRQGTIYSDKLDNVMFCPRELNCYTNIRSDTICIQISNLLSININYKSQNLVLNKTNRVGRCSFIILLARKFPQDEVVEQLDE